MTQKEKLLNLINQDKFAEWLEEHGQFDGSPWNEWFNEKYCNNCESIECTYSEYWGKPEEDQHKLECAYCELEHKCRYFPQHEDVLQNLDIIKLWLETDAI